jgi:hypothetical protein
MRIFRKEADFEAFERVTVEAHQQQRIVRTTGHARRAYPPQIRQVNSAKA